MRRLYAFVQVAITFLMISVVMCASGAVSAAGSADAVRAVSVAESTDAAREVSAAESTDAVREVSDVESTDAVREVSDVESTEASGEVPDAGSTPPIQEDFLELYGQNEHLVGWLTAGESIDYPVVQFDNDFYLHHDFYGNDDNNGVIFVNEYNSLVPRDWLLLIHGHHMRSGAMFGRLMDYEDYEYVCEYPLITFRTIYDEDDVYYVPVAAFNASMEDTHPDYFYIMEPWDFAWEEWVKLQEELASASEMCEAESACEEGADAAASADTISEIEGSAGGEEMSDAGGEEVAKTDGGVEASDGGSEEVLKPDSGVEASDGGGEEASKSDGSEETLDPVGSMFEERIRLRKEAYLRRIGERSIWHGPCDADADDELMMLITCSYYQPEGRFLLLCRKLRVDETPEDILALYWEEMPWRE